MLIPYATMLAVLTGATLILYGIRAPKLVIALALIAAAMIAGMLAAEVIGG